MTEELNEIKKKCNKDKEENEKLVNRINFFKLKKINDISIFHFKCKIFLIINL